MLTHTDCHSVMYLVPEGLTACGSAETAGGSFADFVVGVDLQGGQSLQRASQWEELRDGPPPQLVQSPPPFGAPQGRQDVL